MPSFHHDAQFYARAACVVLTMLSGAVQVLGALINATIDDQLGDPRTGELPVYFPRTIWTLGIECAHCYAKPDPERAYDHTWHDAAIFSTEAVYEELNVTMRFTGTAVYAYCILTNPNNDSWAQITNLTFSIDGAQVGSYFYTSDRTDLYTYDQLVYSNSAVPNGTHTFGIHIPRGANDSVILFDRVVYTYDNAATRQTNPPFPQNTIGPTPSTPAAASSKNSVKYIVAGVVVGVAVILLILLAVLAFLRRRRRRRRQPRAIMDPDSPIDSFAQWQPEPPTSGTHPLFQPTPFDAYAYTALSPSQHPTNTLSEPPLVLSPDEGPTTAGSSSFTTEHALLLHQLEGRQRRLASLRVPESKGGHGRSEGPSATSAEVEDLRMEVERIRRMLLDVSSAPPRYEG